MKNGTNRQRVRGYFAGVLALVIAGILLPALAIAAPPQWWLARGVTDASKAANDYAPANAGQLKKIATEAINELDAKLPGGAGDALHALRQSLAPGGANANDYAPVNLGQLKTLAKPVYDRLIATGHASAYPWVGAASPPNDFAPANIGQVKNLFAFELPVIQSVTQAAQSSVAASTPVAPAPPRISNGNFGTVTGSQTWHNATNSKDYKGGGFQWAYVAAGGVSGWQALTGTQIEVWKTGTEQFVELDASKGNHGIKQQVQNAVPGTYVLTWKHLGRNNAAAGNNGYRAFAYTETKVLGVPFRFELKSQTFPMSGSPISKTAWQAQSLVFTVKPEDIAPPGAPALTLWIAFDSTDNNTYGTLIDDVQLATVEFQVLKWNPILTAPIVSYKRDKQGNIVAVVVNTKDPDGDIMSASAGVQINVKSDLPQADALSSEWDILIFQNIVVSNPGDIVGCTNGAYAKDAAPIPCQDTNNKGVGGSNEYSIPQKRSFTKNNETQSLTLIDTPANDIGTNINLVKGELRKLQRNNEFITWLFAQHRTSKTRVFLKWVRWRAKYDIDFNFQQNPPDNIKAWDFQVMGQGDGVGPVSPVDTINTPIHHDTP